MTAIKGCHKAVEYNKQTVNKTVNMRPSQRFQELTEIVNFCLKLVGLPILVPRIKMNYRTCMTGFVILSFSICGVLWMIKQAEESWMACLKSTIMMGALMTGAGEVVTLLLKQPEIRDMMQYTIDIFEQYEKRGESYVKILNEGIDKLLDIMQIVKFGYMVSYTVMCLVPLGLLLYDGSRVTIVQYQLPGVSLDNNYGYIITYATHVLTMVVAAIGFYAADLMGLLALMQILTFGNILDKKSVLLNAVLQQQADSRHLGPVGLQFNRDDVEYLLLDLIKWHQLFVDYCRNIDEIYHYLIACQVLSSGVSILSTFCVSLSEFHLISVIFFMVSVYRMLLYCIVGTKIEYAYDQVYESICTVSWEELNGAQRKMFNMMLKEAQNSKTIQMVGILPLSVRTALQIAKLIYSLAMMMRNRT